jgi:cysteine desulfurase/selenocysteine lyase
MKLNNEKAQQLKKEFPIFKKKLIYLDNASTTQKPKALINAIKNFYENTNANIHRGVYKISEEATQKFENTRTQISKFLNAKPNEIIFTKNTTESINLLSYSISNLIKGKNKILLTEMEHHSNLIPWQQLAKRKKMKLEFIKIKPDFTLDYKDAEQKITEDTAILSLTHISNSLGTINNIKKLIKLAKAKNIITILDAAQSVPHMPIDVKELNIDFLAFSAHKMLGPTGIGILYGKETLLEKLEPFNFGGNMIREVTYKDAKWNSIPLKFEAGTQNIAGIISFSESINFLKNIGLTNIMKWEKQLLKYTLEKIRQIKNIQIYNPGISKSSGILSFNLKNIHPHDVAALLANKNICVRAGHHCNMPLMTKLNLYGTCRISFYLYNTFQDIDILINEIKKVQNLFENA